MDLADLELLSATVSHALAPRRLGDGDDVLADLGWREMLADETWAAIGVVFDQLGAGCVGSSCLSDVVSLGLGLPPGTPTLLPAFGGARQPGTLDGDRVAVDGIALGATATSDTFAVACSHDEVVMVRSCDLQVTPCAGTDPTLGLATVHGNPAASAVAPAELDKPDATWSTAADLARVALAHEITAASRTMLVLAVDHARDRVQFGRPVASFQAVRHKLAETLVAVEAADAAVEAAHDSPSGVAAALAKVLAGRAASVARRHCQQVLAGIGFTREHEFHRFFLRTMSLDGLFSSTAALTREIGAELLSQQAVPRVVEL